MSNPFFQLYQGSILRYPLLSLLITLSITAYLGSYIPQLQLDASADSLVLEGDKSLQYYRKISQRYDAEDFLLLTFNPHQDLMSDAALADLAQLQQALSTLSGVSSVVTLLDAPLLQSPPTTLEAIAQDPTLPTLRSKATDRNMARTELINSPIYRELLISDDGQTTAIQINLARDPIYHQLLAARESLREQAAQKTLSSAQKKQRRQAEHAFRDYATEYNEAHDKLVAQVRTTVEPYRANAAIFIGGVPMITADMISFIKSDLRIFGVGILAFIVLTLAVIFRQWLWVVLPLGICLLNVSFVLGLMGLLDWSLTVISSNVVALLLIMTLAITLHLVVRYRELAACSPTTEQRQLVTQTMCFMAKPCFYTSLTTVIAFASLVVSGIRPVIDFGWMMTLGITSALVISFIVFPSVLLLLKRPTTPTSITRSVPFTRHFATLTEHYGCTIIISSIILAFLSAYGISQLKVENRFIDYFAKDTAIHQGMEVIDAKLGGTIPLDIIIDPDNINSTELLTPTESVASTPSDNDDFWSDDSASDFDDGITRQSSQWFTRAGLNRIEQVHDYLDSLPETGKVMSLATGYKTFKQLTNTIDDVQLALIQTQLPQALQQFLIDPYLDTTLDETRLTVRVMETSHTLQRAKLLERIHDELINQFGFSEDQVHLTGMLVLYNNMLQSLYRSQILTLGTVFIAILITFVILFRSLSVAILTIIPTLLTAAMVLGAMGLLGIPLDLMTVTIAAITIGIGVDDSIHYIYRFRKELPKDNDYTATMYRCHSSIGKAVLYTSVTIIIGFSILALSNFTPSIYFGLLTSAAMLAALLGVLLLLPRLLMLFKPL